MLANYYLLIMVKGMWEPIVAAVLDDLPVLRSRRTIVYVARFVVHQPWWSFLKKMNKLHKILILEKYHAFSIQI